MKDRVALVTGANRGIGKEVCRQLLAAGYTTILTSRDEEKGRQAAGEFAEFGKQLFYRQLDVADTSSIDAARKYIEDEFGRLDVLVNNAAVNYDTWQSVTEPDFEAVEQSIRINLLGPWRMCVAFLPLMREHKWGRIVNVSSGSGSLHGMGAGTPAYGITKAALNALTIKLAKATKGTGILVNAVGPGWVRTDMGGSAAPRSVEEGAASIMWAVQLPDDGPTGGFFRDGKPVAW